MKKLLPFTLALIATCAYGANPKPNVIVIMADDLGYRDLGFQGSEVVQTPHLDNLASNGVIFTDAHAAASVCSPSRAGFVTGRYQQRFGHEANCPRGREGMVTTEQTIGQAFQSLGYKTYMIGKMLSTWETGTVEPLWQEGKGWVAKRKAGNIKWRDATKVYPTLGAAAKGGGQKDK